MPETDTSQTLDVNAPLTQEIRRIYGNGFSAGQFDKVRHGDRAWSGGYDAGWVEGTKQLSEHSEAAFADGEAKGHKAGFENGRQFERRVHAMTERLKAPTEPMVKQSEAHAAGELRYKQGWEAYKLMQDVANRRTEQLINELYHGRSRLEKVVTDAVNVVMTAHAKLVADCEPMNFVLGVLQQFIDQHGTEQDKKDAATGYGD